MAHQTSRNSSHSGLTGSESIGNDSGAVQRHSTIQMLRSHSHAVQTRFLKPGGAIQKRGNSPQSETEAVHQAASHGIQGGGGSMPHLAAIQHSFGSHDVGGIQAHTGSEATQANEAMGAEAYATGNHVAFKGAPDLHTAAHEAAHVVQQRSGVSLPGGVGSVGDSYEQHADAVADAVVAGQNAEGLLNGMGDGASSETVQQKTKSGDAGQGAVVTDEIILKRKHIDWDAGPEGDKYGHWWTMVGTDESYGWWPKYPVSGAVDTMTGVDGELNGMTSFRGSATKDPHHNDSSADEVYKVELKDPNKTVAAAKNEIRAFASGYSGEWRWTFGFGQNCHTFQESLISKVGLKKVPL